MPKTFYAPGRGRPPLVLEEKLLKRKRGRPFKNPLLNIIPSVSAVLQPSATSRLPQDEARKKISNCIVPRLPNTGMKRGRGRPPRKLTQPPPVDAESDSEDDVPASFSEVVKIIIQKVQETQNEVRIIEESYNNYKAANEESTTLAMKFYAAVPTLHDRVAAGAPLDDDLLESVFDELFPSNGALLKPKAGGSRSVSAISGKIAISPPPGVLKKNGKARGQGQSTEESASDIDNNSPRTRNSNIY